MLYLKISSKRLLMSTIGTLYSNILLETWLHALIFLLFFVSFDWMTGFSGKPFAWLYLAVDYVIFSSSSFTSSGLVGRILFYSMLLYWGSVSRCWLMKLRCFYYSGWISFFSRLKRNFYPVFWSISWINMCSGMPLISARIGWELAALLFRLLSVCSTLSFLFLLALWIITLDFWLTTGKSEPDCAPDELCTFTSSPSCLLYEFLAELTREFD